MDWFQLNDALGSLCSFIFSRIFTFLFLSGFSGRGIPGGGVVCYRYVRVPLRPQFSLPDDRHLSH